MRRSKLKPRYDPKQEPKPVPKEIISLLADEIGCKAYYRLPVDKRPTNFHKALVEKISSLTEATLSQQICKEIIATTQIFTIPSEDLCLSWID